MEHVDTISAAFMCMYTSQYLSLNTIITPVLIPQFLNIRRFGSSIQFKLLKRGGFSVMW
jgi:hypothetical protein